MGVSGDDRKYGTGWSLRAMSSPEFSRIRALVFAKYEVFVFVFGTISFCRSAMSNYDADLRTLLQGNMCVEDLESMGKGVLLLSGT